MKSWPTAVMGIETLLATEALSSFLLRHFDFLNDWTGAVYILVLVAFASVKFVAYDDAKQEGYREAKAIYEKQDK